MKKNLTVIMYHYVRPIKKSKYPNIKGLELDLFKKQVNYLKANYYFTTIEEIVFAKNNNKQLPDNSVLLTFDDGYIDNFKYVLPILKRNNIQGCFYIPFQTIFESKILDVNKIHFILEKANNTDLLIQDIKTLLEKSNLNTSFDEYFKKYAIANRFDNKEVIFIKRLLQVGIEDTLLRSNMVDYLFSKYVTKDEESFSKELYMDKDMLVEMLNNGMHIGNHGYQHFWWDQMPIDLLRQEIEKSTKILKNLLYTHYKTNNYILSCSYPFGGYNENVINVIKQHKYNIAFTVKASISNLKNNNILEIPRLDTNDIPTH